VHIGNLFAKYYWTPVVIIFTGNACILVKILNKFKIGSFYTLFRFHFANLTEKTVRTDVLKFYFHNVKNISDVQSWLSKTLCHCFCYSKAMLE